MTDGGVVSRDIDASQETTEIACIDTMNSQM
jgi:hypothetical protein